jgi:hypothetical protein
MLDHAKLDTTALYTHVAARKLKAVHAATHPAERPTAAQDRLANGGPEGYDSDDEQRTEE